MATQSGRILFGAIDRIVNSPANYRVAMLCDLAAALAFLVLGVTRFSGPFVVAGGLIIVGIMSWGLIEYILHRWVLHGHPPWRREVTRDTTQSPERSSARLSL
jgi:cytochrome b subunit of formate dehydrogenase